MMISDLHFRQGSSKEGMIVKVNGIGMKMHLVQGGNLPIFGFSEPISKPGLGAAGQWASTFKKHTSTVHYNVIAKLAPSLEAYFCQCCNKVPSCRLHS